jgi:hypothetical protein
MLRSKLTSIGIIALVFVSVTTAFARHEQKVSVQVGKSATESHSKIQVEFVEMVEDSRCPKDVDCVWAGNAKIKIKVTKGTKSQVIELNSGVPNKENKFSGYEFVLKTLTPEPASNIRINRNGYVAVISLKKV